MRLQAQWLWADGRQDRTSFSPHSCPRSCPSHWGPGHGGGRGASNRWGEGACGQQPGRGTPSSDFRDSSGSGPRFPPHSLPPGPCRERTHWAPAQFQGLAWPGPLPAQKCQGPRRGAADPGLSLRGWPPLTASLPAPFPSPLESRPSVPLPSKRPPSHALVLPGPPVFPDQAGLPPGGAPTLSPGALHPTCRKPGSSFSMSAFSSPLVRVCLLPSSPEYRAKTSMIMPMAISSSDMMLGPTGAHRSWLAGSLAEEMAR